jgi:hypothetical protein
MKAYRESKLGKRNNNFKQTVSFPQINKAFQPRTPKVLEVDLLALLI